ncbi:MAG: 3-hydroxyacyl-CoA dehydrogenase NAD-binding domain-containing protein [Castellaniella sp.]
MTPASDMPRFHHLSLALGAEGIAWLGLDMADSAVNRLGTPLLQELAQVLDHLGRHRPTAMIIFSAKPAGFCAGADVAEFSRMGAGEAAQAFVARGWRLFDRLADVPWPTLALIHGHCLGGGLELALACRHRLAIDQPDTRMGLPEVRLGILPAWGGLMRLPRLIGAPAALPRVLSGGSTGAREAARLGLVDAAVPLRLARQAAAQHVLAGVTAHRPPLWLRTLNHRRLRPLVARRAAKAVQRRDPHGHYPAPRAMLELWQTVEGNPLRTPGVMAALLQSPVTGNLIRVFQLQERLKDIGRQARAERISQVHVVGAGTMGGGIAAWCALRGLRVSLQDANPDAIARALGEATQLFRRRLPDALAVRAARDRLMPDPHGHGVPHADVIIEAVPEDVGIKHALYAALEPRLQPGAFIATNTSSLPLEQLGEGLQAPQRLVGLHFFNPVAQMPLVEVITTTALDAGVFARTCGLVHQLGKLPLPVRSSPGFLVNAVLTPYLLEAMRCVDEGMRPAVIDEAMRAWGMPMGPLELADTVGLDVARAVGELLAGDATLPTSLRTHLDAQELGRKSGRGFYTWKAGKPERPPAGPVPDGLAERLVQPMVDTARDCVARGIVADADLADAGIIFGTGFAPFRGGPLHDNPQRFEEAQ